MSMAEEETLANPAIDTGGTCQWISGSPLAEFEICFFGMLLDLYTECDAMLRHG
jgi:hypothetical protein